MCCVYMYILSSLIYTLTSYLMCLIKLICSDLGIKWTLGGLTHPVFHTQAFNRLTMGSLSNAPYVQKATPEPHSVQKSQVMNSHILPASSICMLAVVTYNTRISEASWVLVQYSCGAPSPRLPNFTHIIVVVPIKPEVPCLQTSTCLTFSKWWVLPGFRSTKAGSHKTSKVWLHITIFCYPSLLTSGDSTGLSAEGIVGRLLLILAWVISLVVWVLWLIFTAVFFYDHGKHVQV